jgi:hypothetical protein
MVGATSPAGPPRLPLKSEGVQDQGARKQRAQDQSKKLGNTTLTHLSLPFQALVARTIFSVQKSPRPATNLAAAASGLALEQNVRWVCARHRCWWQADDHRPRAYYGAL